MRTTIRKHDKPDRATSYIADELFKRLEAEPDTIQSKRVGHVLALLARLGQNEWDFPTFTQLREPLRRYKWRYGLTLGKGGLRAELAFTEKMSGADEWEHRMIRWLMSLVPHHIDRLRRCAFEGCKRWLFAGDRYDQKFCKGRACRQLHHDSDPKHREQKNERMRENRKWHRDQTRRAKVRLRAGKAGARHKGS